MHNGRELADMYLVYAVSVPPIDDGHKVVKLAVDIWSKFLSSLLNCLTLCYLILFIANVEWTNATVGEHFQF
ncbi:hypothetical protein BDV33DRAFT_164465 [Aspergillus novoparasiticus]|uniref:Uncharacterized protein n=1 Tax=Aspergillus novoparasiticus TaxID=986946 RepID=A0A5N6F8H0_9EURO|nr:hypothetical protein BDV33DRAFT_164465 [Aspergillus novoparasiticus]